MYCSANFTSEIYFKIKIKYVIESVRELHIWIRVYDEDGVPVK